MKRFPLTSFFSCVGLFLSRVGVFSLIIPLLCSIAFVLITPPIFAQTSYGQLDDDLGLKSPGIPGLNSPEPFPVPGRVEPSFDLPRVDKEGIRVRLRPIKRGFVLGEGITMEVEIVNRSENRENFRFLIEKNYFYQLRVRLYDSFSVVPQPTVTYATWQYLKNNPDVAKQNDLANSIIALPTPRLIDLAYGESFKFAFHLEDFFRLDQEGNYFVRVDFFPALLGVDDYFFTSYEATFGLRVEDARSGLGNGGSDSERGLGELHRPRFLDEVPAPVGQTSANLAQNAVVGTIPNASSGDNPSFYSPTAVVEKNLTDQQQKNWQPYLESYQLDELLANSYLSTMYFERFQGARANEIPIILEDFSRFLVESIDFEVIDYEPLRTTITGDIAKVEVLVKSVEAYTAQNEILNPLTGQVEQQWMELPSETLDRSRIFIYDLRRIRGQWKIVSIDTRVRERTSEQETMVTARPEEEERIGFVYFRLNESEILPQFFANLEQVARLASRDTSLKIRLVGYTDDLGTDDYNARLATQRVNSVAERLAALGVAEDRFSREPRGEVQVGDEVITEQLRSRNRRVEIYFYR